MLNKNNLSIFEWLLLIFIMSLPFINVVFLIWGVVTNKFSKNIQNFVIAFFIFYILVGGGLFRSGIL